MHVIVDATLQYVLLFQLVCQENGSCEVHTLNAQFSTLTDGEHKQFESFLHKLA